MHVKSNGIGFHTATWDVQGAFIDQDPNDVDRIFMNRVHPVALGCLQNTGSPVASLETDNYIWKVSKVQERPQYDMLPSGGTAFLLHKQHMKEFVNLDFFKVTENIVGCEFEYGGRKMRVISVFIADDRTAKPEFTLLITHLLNTKDTSVTTILMGNFNAEIGKHDQLKVGNSERLMGRQLLHIQSNENGLLLKGLIELTGFTLSSSFSDSETTLETWANRDRTAQLDHILLSHAGDFMVEEQKARYIDRISTNHKCIFAKIAICDQMERLFEPPAKIARRSTPSVSTTTFRDDEGPLPGFKAVTINVQNASSPQMLLDIDRVLNNKQIALACVQCTGLTMNYMETEHYYWKLATARARPNYNMTMSGGTGILIQKSRKQDFEDIEFLNITDQILCYKCIYFGRKMQIISAYLVDDETAKLEFTELISYLVKTADDEVTTVLMGDFHAEIGKYDQVMKDLKIGNMVGHYESNSNGILLKGLLELTKFELHNTFGTSETVLVTCVDVDKSKEVQWDHVIVSHYNNFVVGKSTAEWIPEIKSNHKGVFTEFNVKTKPIVKEPSRNVLVTVANDRQPTLPPHLGISSWNIAGSLKFNSPQDIDAALQGSFQSNNKYVTNIACIQNCGIDKEVYETKQYKWKISTNSGTAILFSKSMLNEVSNMNFSKITDNILECTFVWLDLNFRLISVYIAEDHSAKSEFTKLITHLVSTQDDRVYTIVMGDFSAEIGRKDQDKMSEGVRIGRQLFHEHSNENGILLIGLLSLTQYRLQSSVTSSKTVLSTCRKADGTEAQVDHVICSADDSLLQLSNVTATWIDDVRTNHKRMFLRIKKKTSSTDVVESSPSPSLAQTSRPYVDASPVRPNVKDTFIVGSLNMSRTCNSQAAVDAFDTVFAKEPLQADPFLLLCLQNTGLSKGTLETQHYDWKTSTGGTSIVMHKDLQALITSDINFFEITDTILGCDMILLGKKLRLLSVYVPDDMTAKLAFTDLITYLMKNKQDDITTILMGDFNAMVGKNDQYGAVDRGLAAYGNLMHDNSNENGVLLKGLLELTDYSLTSGMCLSKSVLTTCERGQDRRPVQIDHVLASRHKDFSTFVLMAKWLPGIDTNHKALVTKISGQTSQEEQRFRFS